MGDVTIIITPRDRYTGLDECITNLYELTEYEFDLVILDLGYPKTILEKAKKLTNNRKNVQFYNYGLITPMAALEKARRHVNTKYTVLLDNDSRVTKGWLGPLIAATENDAVIVSPLTLEKAGVDDGAALRNHLHSCDIRVVEYASKDYLIEDKKYRRALPEELPTGIQTTDTFELHCVLFQTNHLKAIEIPQMVVREHIDIGMQTRNMGKSIVVQPESVIIFDNLNTRMSISDMKYFFFRWDKKLSKESHELFEKRWGYKFYNENSMYIWVIRRKIFLILRYFGMPIWFANKFTGLVKRLAFRDWDPVDDPVKRSSILRELKVNDAIKQLDHQTRS